MNIAEVNVRANAHNFLIAVNDKGAVTFKMDEEEVKHAKCLQDGKLCFIGVHEVVVKGEIQDWKEMILPKEEYAILEDAQKRVLAAAQEAQDMARLKREDKSDLLRRVDKWKKRVRHYKPDKEKKERVPYAIHDFTIGAQSYRFYERHSGSPVAQEGVLINPAYKVDHDLDGTGAVPIQKGELTFWFYHSEDEGWFNVRELTLNEMICVEIIRSHGLVREGKF